VNSKIMAGKRCRGEERKQHSQRSKNGQAQRDQPRGQNGLVSLDLLAVTIRSSGGQEIVTVFEKFSRIAFIWRAPVE